MSSWTIVRRSLIFYWRTHTGVLLGVAIGTAVLVGALVVGDSIRDTLKTIAFSRLGKVQLALANQNRYFRAALAANLESAMDAPTAPVLQVRGIAINNDGSARVNRIQVLGTDERFWRLLDAGYSMRDTRYRTLDTGSEVIINERLASHLSVKEGDDILLRVEKASLLPRDAPMSIGEDFTVALRMTVKSVASDTSFGRFSLQASQIAPYNAFVSLAWLQKKLDLPDRANMLLIGDGKGKQSQISNTDDELREHWELADAGLELRELPEQRMLELRTDRIFLEPTVINAAKRAMPGATGILTYFVNELRLGHRATPYSIVSAVESPRTRGSLPSSPSHIVEHADGSFVPEATLRHKTSWQHVLLKFSEMGDDEILINTWLAEDLQANAGDIIEMTYFVFGPMRRLEERASRFRVRAILPLGGIAADPELMPGFPGLSNVDNCRDWKPGIEIDLNKIRKKDEEYWNLYRGTPKAFITLKAGQSIWGNRFGNLTALRCPLESGSQVESAIKRELDPASMGLFFQPVGKQMFSQTTNFGQLFLGLSFFLIIASSLLTGLLFVFGIQQRTEEMGTLLAMGFSSRKVRRLFLFEGGILALMGGLLGICLGIWYTKAALYALSNVWRGAVGGAVDLHYHAEPLTLVSGTLAGIIVGLLAIWLTSLKQARHSVRELLAGEMESGPVSRAAMPNSEKVRSDLLKLSPSLKFQFGLFAGSGIIALVILVIAGTGKDIKAAGVFFVAGALLLICCLSLSYILMTHNTSRAALHGLTEMGLHNVIRCKGRSLATIGMLACGSFLIIAIGANRHDALKNSEKRWSGTGGFTLYGESTIPVLHNLDSADGHKAYGLDTSDLEGVEFVSLRVHNGEDASCLNLNRVRNPGLLGVNPEELQKRNAFKFVKTADESRSPWLLLGLNEDENTVNAIADQNTISWSLGKSVGDTLPYTDERGQTFNIHIVGAIANSVFQGSFLISEEEFIKRFPSESGYRVFLIDTPSINMQAGISDSRKEVSKKLTYAFQDMGLDLTPTVERLAAFNAVENTYLSIFQALGGLALLLGSLGLGIVVLRNVMERRSELALMRAVGFQRRSLQWLVLSEHWLLLFVGLVCGVVAGLVAVLPALRSPGAGFPYISLAVTLCAIVFSGLIWTWLATRLALRGPLLAALRNE